MGSRTYNFLTGWRAWLWWMLTIAFFPWLARLLRIGSITTGNEFLDIIIFLFSGAICVTYIVVAQWFVIRSKVRFLPWCSATLSGWILGLLLQILIFQGGKLALGIYVPHFLHGAAFGAVLGWFQRRALKPWLGNSPVWIRTNIISWSLGWLGLDLMLLWAYINKVPTNIDVASSQPVVVSILSVGAALIGAITGAVMVTLLKKHETSG